MNQKISSGRSSRNVECYFYYSAEIFSKITSLRSKYMKKYIKYLWKNVVPKKNPPDT